MLPTEAIQHINQAAAIDAANGTITASADTVHAFVALPSDYRTHDLEHLLPQRRRARGVMQTHSIAAAADYIEAHAEQGTTVFVDAEHMAAVAVLNLGAPDAPGHADNTVKLTLKRTAAFDALLKVNGRTLAQKDAAEWLEDFAAFASCRNDGDEEIATKHAVQALRQLKIDASRTVESKVGTLSSSSSALDQVAVSSTNPIPTLVHWHCVPYLGLPPRRFVARLGILTGDKPGVVLRIINAEQHQEEMAEQLAQAVRDAIPDDAAAVVLGSYSKAS